MSLRAFRKRPPYLIPNRARALLPCAPCISQRGTHPMYYPELAFASGPEALGVTGDNSFETLFGREWALLFCDDNQLLFLQWDDGGETPEGLLSPGWKTIAEPLLTLPEFTGNERAFTLAFDQSARIIYAYEIDGLITVTRWDDTAKEYKQNVNFAGRDPTLFMDATTADPRAYPNLDDDGWSIREAYDAGLRVLFEWVPDGQWRDTAIPDSDVVLFYLTLDRQDVKARVQRELYGTVRDVFSFAEPLVLDYATAVGARWQLLIANAIGTRKSEMLHSALYIDDFMPVVLDADALDLGLAPEDIAAVFDTYIESATDDVALGMTPEDIAVVGALYLTVLALALDLGMTPEDALVVTMMHFEISVNALGLTMPPEDALVVTTTVLDESEDDLDFTMAPTSIRAQTV